jgi:formate-dependent nitrite reductase cytochrome c552 subunit
MVYFRKNVYGMIFIFLAVFTAGLAVPSAYAEDMCIDCHKNEKYRVQNKMLFEYYQNWKDSVHELAGVACIDCHGGDADQKNKDRAHKNNFSSLISADRSTFKIIPERCGKCHESVLSNYTESKHYRALVEKGTGPQCATCHGSMNAEVYYTSVVARSCKECHNEYTKNRPEIVGEADKILHRINVSRALNNWVSIYYSDKEPETVEKMNALYQDVAESWHKFDFTMLDEKSEKLLAGLKSLVNKKLAEKRKKKTD